MKLIAIFSLLIKSLDMEEFIDFERGEKGSDAMAQML